MSDNESHFCIMMAPEQLSEEERVLLRRRRAALLNSVKWGVGDTITIRFLEDAQQRFGKRAVELQDRVKQVALEWTKLANLTFLFGSSAPADIRIAFQEGNGSWSYLGTYCRKIPEPEPTMNYGWLTPDSSDDELKRVVRHEFGHALGLIHEHQNPQGGIQWNRDAVVRDLSGPPNNWSEATIDNNIFAKYADSDVIATNVDPDSIMMYPIPKAWTLDGFSADLNSELSVKDKEFIVTNYPK
jgi:serralysin